MEYQNSVPVVSNALIIFKSCSTSCSALMQHFANCLILLAINNSCPEITITGYDGFLNKMLNLCSVFILFCHNSISAVRISCLLAAFCRISYRSLHHLATNSLLIARPPHPPPIRHGLLHGPHNIPGFRASPQDCGRLTDRDSAHGCRSWSSLHRCDLAAPESCECRCPAPAGVWRTNGGSCGRWLAC